MKYIVSVAKTYTHRGKHHHKPSTKKRWCIYYYDEEGHFRSKIVSYLQAMYFKTKKLRRLSYYCTDCRNSFFAFVKSKKDTPQCPFCEV